MVYIGLRAHTLNTSGLSLNVWGRVCDFCKHTYQATPGWNVWMLSGLSQTAHLITLNLKKKKKRKRKQTLILSLNIFCMNCCATLCHYLQQIHRGGDPFTDFSPNIC